MNFFRTKQSASLFGLLLLMGLVTAHVAAAVVYDPLQDSAKHLQPAPAGVAPNVGNNVNYQGTTLPNVDVNQNGPDAAAAAAQDSSTGTAATSGSNLPAAHNASLLKLLWWCFGVIVVAGAGYFMFIRYDKK